MANTTNYTGKVVRLWKNKSGNKALVRLPLFFHKVFSISDSVFNQLNVGDKIEVKFIIYPGGGGGDYYLSNPLKRYIPQPPIEEFIE